MENIQAIPTLLCVSPIFLFFLWKLYFARQRNVIVTLPPELLYLIGSHLSLPSKACLALSCKHLHDVFGSVLSAPEFRLPKVMQFDSRHFSAPANTHIRLELLIRLQNRKWRYCAACLRLHPRREFGHCPFLDRPEERRCNIFTWSGIVDLCPCTHMTFRDKNRLVTSLMDMQRHVETPRPKSPILYKFVADKSERTLTHTCSITHFAKVINFTVVAFLGESSNLVIETEFDIKSTQGSFSSFGLPLNWKPHSSLDDCLSYAMKCYSPGYDGRDLSGEIMILKLVPDGELHWGGMLQPGEPLAAILF